MITTPNCNPSETQKPFKWHLEIHATTEDGCSLFEFCGVYNTNDFTAEDIKKVIESPWPFGPFAQ